ncbi:MAG TPA: hypothetical protein VF785_04900 [Gemmatimonadaceae bacterium]
MTDKRMSPDDDSMLDPEDVNSAPASASPNANTLDANDEVPVPIAMSAAEIDERAQAVDALRGAQAAEPLEDQRTQP